MNFPDLPHLKQLQKDLWQWPKSRAAVMVGAGFSINAEPLPGVTSHFPTWQQLTRAMFDELYPPQGAGTAEEKQRREKQFLGANALRIASEYEASFGKQKLEQLIRIQNPDTEHKPAKLHSLLLELPWSDVFTTNYDTLLERTEIPGRTYQPVTKAGELTTAFSPRIVKLHGSFPSQTPFIISEEDYRTYPSQFAPFVNSVQQSLLENSFVLVGFSGDDPNFLAWTGWIRDELGGKHAPIYLVGPLALRPATRALLGKRGVTPIDLAPLFDGENRYRDSLEWFLRSLAASRPPRLETWPKLERGLLDLQRYDPPLATDADNVPEHAEQFPDPRTPLTHEQVRKVFERWRFERTNYPGWLVAEESKRLRVFDATKHWMNPILEHSKNLDVADQILLFREINWRLETAMVPLFLPWIEHFERATAELYPTVESLKASLPKQQILPQADGNELIDAWLTISFGLLREAREMYNAERWTKLKQQIDKVVTRRPQFADRNHYEAALWEMWNINRKAAKQTLANWEPSRRSPLAFMWKAGLLAELGDLGDSRTLLRGALSEIRNGLRINGRNIELLSLEGWCTYLLSSVEMALDFLRLAVIQYEFGERWQELKGWDCNPWPRLEYFMSALSSSPPIPRQPMRIIRGFDPGEARLSHSFGGGIEPYLPAFSCIRLYEQAGIPMHLPRVTLTLADALAKACGWIAPFTSFWSPALLIRAGDTKSKMDEYLTRTKVADMDPALANRLCDWCFTILEREINGFSGSVTPGSAQEALFQLLPEVLSRLAFKADDEQLKRAFLMALRFHRLPAIRSHHSLHEVCEPWFRRLFEAADESLLLDWIPILLRNPLFDEGVSHLIPEERAWPDPMSHFPFIRISGTSNIPPEKKAEIEKAAGWLMRKAAAEEGEAKRRALSRLTYLNLSKLLSQPERQRLGELLWSTTTNSGLPDLPGLAPFSFLHLPTPTGLDVHARLKSYILSLPPQSFTARDATGKIVSVAMDGRHELIEEVAMATKPAVQLRGTPNGAIEWSQAESKELYGRARAWWASDKGAANRRSLGQNPVLETASTLGDFLSRAVIPALSADDPIWPELLAWLGELRGMQAFPTVCLPYILHVKPDQFEQVTANALADLHGDLEEAIPPAAKALRHWYHLAAVSKAPQPPAVLIDALVGRVVFRRTPSLQHCISELAMLIVDKPESISLLHFQLLVGSLDQWLRATVVPASEVTGNEFAEADRPQLRVLVGRLAGALSRWLRVKTPNAVEPATLGLWRMSCSSDSMPEVRRAFTIWDEPATAPDHAST